jgi:hypothetical protein
MAKRSGLSESTRRARCKRWRAHSRQRRTHDYLRPRHDQPVRRV